MMNRIRKPKGVSMIVISLMAAFFIILPLGVFGFELMRFTIAQQQLRSICDSAALSGAVGVASTKSTWTPEQAQTEAMKAAYITFRQNILMGQFLGAAGVASVHFNDNISPTSVPPSKLIVSFTLLDQNLNRVETGNPAAKLMRVEAIYGYVPPIGSAFGFTEVPLTAFAEGGLPQLDLVLCFDISGSMDDQTPVTFVRKYWDTTANTTKYQAVSVPRSGNGQPASCIYNVNGPTNAGSSVNANPPQNLTYANYPRPPYETGNSYPYAFSPDLRCAPAFGSNELGAPPGNKTDPGISSGAGSSPAVFTDLVVNLDNNNTFAGYTDPVTGVKFPNLATLVEASRGNLNSPATMASAAPGINWSSYGVSANPSYQNTYRTLAKNATSPMNAAITAAGNFYNTMNISANCHFGFVAFSDGIGTDENSKWEDIAGTTANVVDKTYNKAGTSTYALPVVKLVKDPATNNYTKCRDAVSKLVATGKTDIADSVNEAIDQLKVANGLTRDKARRAIVLFTDGIPNVPGGSTGNENSPAANACYTSANTAKTNNIAIFAIGLSQNNSIKPIMKKILKKMTDTTGGSYYEVSNPADLETAFQTIAKSLIVLK